MPYLDRDGVEIYYETRGEGPAILLTHGYSATAEMWARQLEVFSDDHTVISWDMRGHGRSGAPHDASQYSEALTTADMAALLKHLGFEKAVIGGLSLGGYMSLAFNCDFPEMAEALLIIDCGPGYKKDAPRNAWNASAHERADDIDAGGLAALEGGSAERAIAVHENPHGLAYAARYMLTQHTPRVIESLPDISVPAIVVVGEEDEPFLAASDYMAAKISGATKAVIPNAGHAVNLDQPDAFNTAIRDFLTTSGL